VTILIHCVISVIMQFVFMYVQNQVRRKHWGYILLKLTVTMGVIHERNLQKYSFFLCRPHISFVMPTEPATLSLNYKDSTHKYLTLTLLNERQCFLIYTTYSEILSWTPNKEGKEQTLWTNSNKIFHAHSWQLDLNPCSSGGHCIK
jgi:hypothetical protein